MNSHISSEPTIIRHLAALASRYANGFPKPAEPGKPVTVVIVNYNCQAHLSRCLRTLAKQTFSDFYAIVIDNASTNDSIEKLSLPDDRFKLVSLSENLGFAAANNLGAYWQPAPFIATLNPDAFPEPEWLERLMAGAKKYPKCAAFGSTQLLDKEVDFLDGAGDELFIAGIPWRGGHRHPFTSLPDVYESFSPCAAAALYRSREFWAAGGFDEKFFCYCEDVDLGFRLRLMGYKSLQISKAVVRHHGGGSSDAISGFSEYYGHRNAILMHIKNMPPPLLWITLFFHVLAEMAMLGKLGNKIVKNPKQCLGIAKARLKGVGQALFSSSPVWAQRKNIQRKKTITALALAKQLNWSPAALIRKKHRLRPLTAGLENMID